MINLYGGPTTNVRKVAIALEELGVQWRPKTIRLQKQEQFEETFLKISPNNKIPVIEDLSSGVTVWESGAILTYLGETYDCSDLILTEVPEDRARVMQWVFFQAAHVGPNFGRLNDQVTAPINDRNPGMLKIFLEEATRVTNVIARSLDDGRSYIAGDYSIADIMLYPWMKAAMDQKFQPVIEAEGIVPWLERIGARSAVQRGMSAFGIGEGANKLK